MSEYELWNEIGNLYFLSGTYEPAIHAYTKAIDLDSKFGRPYSNLALVYVQKGQYEQAIELYRRSIELLVDTREKAISWNRLGNVYRQLKDYYMAVAAYQKADELNPESREEQDQPGGGTDTPLMFLMPAPNVTPSTSEQASAEVETSAATPSDNQPATTQTAVVLLPVKLVAPIVETSREAETAWSDQLSAIEETDDFDHYTFQSEADACTDPSDENIIPQDDDWLPLLLEDREFCHPELDNFEIPPGQLVEEGEPILPTNLQKLGTGFEKTSDISIPQELPCPEREMAITNPIGLDPNPQNESDLENLSSVPAIENEVPFNAINDLDVNASTLDLAILAETSPVMAVEVCDPETVAMPLPEEKHITQETEANQLKKVVELNPRNAMAWDALGSLYKTNGQYQEAIFAYEQAISIETNNASFHYHLGLIYAAADRNEDALRIFKKVIDLDPNFGLAHATLSGYYRRMGLEELARRHLNKALNNTFQNENEYNRACLESICGNADQALEYLELALQNQQSYADWALHDPDLDFIRNDPRFKALIARYTNAVKMSDEKHYYKVQMGCG
jgi:tetratricopeptide (TPR) repeat protein